MGSFGGRLLLGSSECVAAAPSFTLPRLHYPVRPLNSKHTLAFRCCNGSASSDPPPDPAAIPSSRKSKRPPKESLPRGLRRYETTVVLRPDITEEERLAWTQRYDEAIIAGGATSVEFSNRGILPLTYSIKKKDLGGVARTYLDGVYMHIAYITKPQCQLDLQKRFNQDDDVIRSITMLLNLRRDRWLFLEEILGDIGRHQTPNKWSMTLFITRETSSFKIKNLRQLIAKSWFISAHYSGLTQLMTSFRVVSIA
ncbi:hypothetical protein GOP47_0026603 [Adiantum capillus-veneris]|nr:hypothetical protein GOP47_0026603 [Adiantum capillus-veneris]